MKRLLTVLAAFSMTAVGTMPVVACNKGDKNSGNPSIKGAKMETVADITLTVADPAKLTVAEAAKINEDGGLTAAVLKAVQDVAKEATAADYTISNDAEGKDASSGIDVKVIVKAKTDSKKIIGKFNFNVKVTATKAGGGGGEAEPTTEG